MEGVLNDTQQLLVAAGTEVLMKAVAVLWADRLKQLPEADRLAVLDSIVNSFGTPGPTGPMRDDEADLFRAMAAGMPFAARRLGLTIRQLLEMDSNQSR